MRNSTWNRFVLKICWSIPCLHPSWKVHTWSYYSSVRGSHKLLLNSPRPDILHNVIVSGNVTFCQINKFFFVILIFLIGKMFALAGFGPRAIVWRPCSRGKSCLKAFFMRAILGIAAKGKANRKVTRTDCFQMRKLLTYQTGHFQRWSPQPRWPQSVKVSSSTYIFQCCCHPKSASSALESIFRQYLGNVCPTNSQRRFAVGHEADW